MLKMKADSYTSYSRTLIDGESCCIASCTLENGTTLSFVDNYWRDSKDKRYLEVNKGACTGFIRLTPTLPMGDRQTAVESLIAGLDITTQEIIIEHIPEWSQYLGLSELEIDELVGGVVNGK